MKTITIAAIVTAPAIVLAAGGVTAAAMLAPNPAPRTITRTEVVYRTRTVTRWKTRTVTDTVTVTDPGALQCAEEEAATITAMQNFMLANAVTGPDPTQNYAKVPDNADGFTTPSEAACAPYEDQLLGG